VPANHPETFSDLVGSVHSFMGNEKDNQAPATWPAEVRGVPEL
jgi:hypothetical protein